MTDFTNMVVANLDTQVTSTLEDMQCLIYTEEMARVTSAVKDKDIVIFLGNTRSGKSTLVNYIIGNKLQSQLVRKTNFNIVQENPAIAGPTIGTVSVSETTTPTVWPSSKISGLVVDAPGFDDNRGEAQDVANAFYITELVKNARSVKFVLICDINDLLNHNIGQFIAFIDKIYTMFPLSSILPSVCVVITKDRHQNSREDIVEILREKIVSQTDIKVSNRVLVDHLVKNSRLIAITNMPMSAGPVDEIDVFQDVVDVIENQTRYLNRDVLSTVVPGISDKSKCFLLEAHARFSEMEDFKDAMSKAVSDFESIISQVVERKNTAKANIAHLQGAITSAQRMENLGDIMRNLYELTPNVRELQEGSMLYTKLDFVSFVDSVLEIEESSVFKVRAQLALAAMMDSLNKRNIMMQKEMMEISREEADRRYEEFKEENRKMQLDMQKRIDDLSRVNEQGIVKMRRNVGVFTLIGEALDSFVQGIGLVKGVIRN